MRKIVSLVAVLGIALAACSDGGTTDEGAGNNGKAESPDLELIAALQPFDACDDLLAYVKEQALEQVGPYGLGGEGYYGGPVMEDGLRTESFEEVGRAIDEESDVASAPLPRTGDDSSEAEGNDFSGTNVQEAGVDEPDIVKTDGTRVLVAMNSTLYYIDTSGDAPVIVSEATLPGGYDHQLLLDGDRVLALSQGDSSYIEPLATEDEEVIEGDAVYPPQYESVTVLTQIDISNPERMDILATQYVEGTYISARSVDGRARIVTTANPIEFDFVYPTGPGSEETAEETNRQIIEESEIEAWVPQVVTENAQGQTEETDLLPCEQISRPSEFSGFGMLSVMTVDLGEDLDITDTVSVMADGDTVYSSTESLFIGTGEWLDPILFSEGDTDDQEEVEEGYTTQLHKFDITGDGPADYKASGEVRGHMLSSYSMSEHEGFLRVATTDGTPFGTIDATESYVTVLDEADGQLRQVGQVGEMGKGEDIQSVRFVGDVAYVVTFRQTDPLYTVDLSDPANPVVAGELKILGYSAYLHPAGDGLLIGVGQDATDQGRTLGTQVSLFDVSDLANPVRLQQIALGSGSSEAEYDPHAFLWWDATDLAVLPVNIYNYNEGFSEEFYGAIGLTVTPEGITELGRISHSGGAEIVDYSCPPDAICPVPSDILPYPSGAQIRRSLVINTDQLLTISDAGVQANNLGTLAVEGAASF